MSTHRWSQTLKLAAVVGCTVVLSTGCLRLSSESPFEPAPTDASVRQAPNPTLQVYYDQQLVWRDCGAHECSKLIVPLDYDNPDAGTVAIEVLRNSATSGLPSPALVMNPGGPGGSGVEFAARTDIVTPAVHAAYDLVGFDPRGVASSQPVVCLDDAQVDQLYALDPTPDNLADEQEIESEAQAFAQACAAQAGALLAHMDSQSVARDMDILRAALNQPLLNYLGFSYGTYLGALYANEFAPRVGRTVLDGGIDPYLSNSELALGQAEGFELAFDQYVDYCIEQGNCPLGNSRVEARARLSQFLAALDQQPLVASNGRELTEGLALYGVIFPLYFPEQGWPLLTDGLRDALAGDPDELISTIDLFLERQPDGSYANNSSQVIYAVNCLDHAERDSADQVREQARTWVERAPLFGPFLAYGNMPCAFWPVPAQAPDLTFSQVPATQVLVVGTEFDPATPLVWSQKLAEAIPDAVLVTWENGQGHTAYNRGNACINHTVDRYLLDGEVPAADKVCQ